jgi:hypothetical protein
MTIRNILSTDVVANLLKDSKIEIICCLKNPNKYAKYISHKRIKYINFYKINKYSISAFLLMILTIRFNCINDNKSIQILKKGPVSKQPESKILYLFKYPFPKSKLIYKFISFILNFFYIPKKNIEEQFFLHKPDLVFANHIVTKDEFDYILTAKKNGIPVVGMVKSFDNLTTKGFVLNHIDFVILWNKVMMKEMIDIYKFNTDKLFITGVPQFDIYKTKPQITKKQYLKKHKLSENKKLILFSTNGFDISPDDPANVEFIASKLDKLNANMIVRLHPNDTSERYKGLKFKNVFYNIPGISEGHNSHARVAHNKFLEDLRDNLFFSDVTINTASTMTLDAVAMNKPIINICFDVEKKIYSKSVKRFYDLIHYESIINNKSTSLAESKDDLIILIKEYLKNTNMKELERKSLNETMLDGNHGKASLKVSKAIHTIIENLNS